MAKDVPNLPAAAATPAKAESTPPAPKAEPTVSIPVSEWETMKEQLAVMQVQLLDLSKRPVAAPTPAPVAPTEKLPQTIGRLEVIPLPEGYAPPADSVRMKFRVGLPHNREAIIVHDLPPGQSAFNARDEVIRKYNKYYGIIKTEHQHQVVEEAA